MNRLPTVITKNYFFIIGVIVVFASFLFTYDVPFFWDALSKSLRANWLYTNNFAQFVVPTDLNSGHPPLWISLLALVWKMFGQTLLVSRILLLVLNLGVVYQLQLLVKNFKLNYVPWYWYLILLIEPTYLAQTTILNNDVLMLFMILVSFNNIFKNRILYSLAITAMLFCNLRGMFFFVGFVIYDLQHHIFKYQKNYKEYLPKTLAYLLPVISFISYVYYQFSLLGWAIKQPKGDWDAHRQLVDIKHFIHNIIAIVWVFADFGRFLFWIILLVAGYIIIKKRKKIDSKTFQLVIFSACIFITYTGAMTLTSNPIGHRYFMLFYILELFLFINFIHIAFHKKKTI